MQVRAREGEDGFVLAEILTAMVVLAIAVIAFLQILQDRTGGLRDVRAQTAKIERAHTLMQEISEASERESQTGFDEATGLHWEVSVLPDRQRQAKSAEQPSVLTIRVKVWNDPDKAGMKAYVLNSAVWARR